MNLKPYAKVGKEALTNMLIAHNSQKSKQLKIEDMNFLLKLNYEFNSYCTNCPLRASGNNNYCLSYCDNFRNYSWNEIDLSGEEISLLNTKAKVFKPSEKKLSRFGILLYTYLHFLNVDKHGIIKNADVRDMAFYLKCDVKTIENNMKILNEIGLIWVSHVSRYKCSIKIVNYKTYHLTAKEGGKGYMHLTIDILNELIEIKNVNSLRTFISLILKQDEDRIKSNKKENVNETEPNEKNIQEKNSSKISINKLKSRLPKYINNVNIIKDVLKNDNLAKLFDFQLESNIINFKIKDKYNIESYKENLINNYENQIDDYIKLSKLEFLEKDRKDLLQMSIQYGIDTLLNVLPIVEKEILETDYQSNYCGYIRNKICSTFNTNYEEAI